MCAGTFTLPAQDRHGVAIGILGGVGEPKEDGTLETVSIDEIIENGYNFSMSHFSEYAIIEKESKKYEAIF